MSIRPPLIDTRSETDLRHKTRGQLYNVLSAVYGWKQPANQSDSTDTSEPYGGEACDALVHIFARYCHHIVERINRTQEKHFLAFLDLLGNTPIAAAPARTVVSFALDGAARQGRLLPAGTRLQALSAASNAVLYFETEQDLWLSNLSLKSLMAANGGVTDDWSTLIDNGNDDGNGAARELFSGKNNRYTFLFEYKETARLPEGEPVELYVWIDSPRYQAADSSSNKESDKERKGLTWELGRKDDRKGTLITVEDETDGLTRSGVIRFLGPAGNTTPFWLSVSGDQDPTKPAMLCVAINSVAALQCQTLVGEVLGSSSGQVNQQFFAAHQPVMSGQLLSVLEIAANTGAEPLVSEDSWVPWQETPDFHASGPCDRHYVLNRQSGKLRFGDGKRGMIPPAGARNIRLTNYRAGGGAAGNVFAGAIKSIVSNTYEVVRVKNLFAASGGAEAEQTAALLQRAPRSLRHRQRAVTKEDYEDLALQATTGVARAECVPLHNLQENAYKILRTKTDEESGVGKVSVIIVPADTGERPQPTLDLLQRVRAYLRERCCVEAHVEVVGPLYLPVVVNVSVQIESQRDTVTTIDELNRRCLAYLHPLTGGRDGCGWPFGRLPHASDFYAVLAGTPHVKYISALDISYKETAQHKKIFDTKRFLVCADKVTVKISDTR
ncbi:putative baseplate assembly protein [Undibacterium sp. Ji50W]|uniref:putative baseplate assembly protein n=1 Tax=Undibacterium sp. Ji50W TaxID=3413041 RepID=UPI003BF34127